ncbi:TVP38/TMEM64 family protein [Clostridium botulinum]|nr:TVP38/TMEM64 family protein [Clostridium botulinum]NFS97547.1 TVP38/TMEM64 family protein [Clostridium botulinum]
MDWIDRLFQLCRDSFELMFVIGFLVAFTESFFSPLPLLGIVITNSVLLGFFPGLIASTLGSVLGSTLLFYICKEIGNIRFINKIKTNQVDKIIEWVRVQGFLPMTISYSCPFIPGFLVTIAAGISKKSMTKYFPGMLCGKVIMFSVASYIGYDLKGFLTSPLKIAIVALIVGVSLFIGRKLSKTMEMRELNKVYI